jgi:hypothetical protein
MLFMHISQAHIIQKTLRDRRQQQQQMLRVSNMRGAAAAQQHSCRAALTPRCGMTPF